MPRLEDTLQNRIKVSLFDTMKSYWDEHCDEVEYIESKGGVPSDDQERYVIEHLVYMINNPEQRYKPSFIDNFTTFNTTENEYKVDSVNKMKKLWDDFDAYQQSLNNDDDNENDNNDDVSDGYISNNAKSSEDQSSDSTSEQNEEASNTGSTASRDEVSDSEHEDNYETIENKFIVEFLDPIQRVPFRNENFQYFVFGNLFAGVVGVLGYLFSRFF